jgi:hypothetical protein
VIARWDHLRSSELTSVTPDTTFNIDVLFTWMLNPWTAFYVGYNGNAANEWEFRRQVGPATHDRDALFAKLSWLWRP